ncbi:LacI family DNA-binding transcriptional regulator [Streptomyces prunicolor]|uniref:LacI family DNA-binding transcriptional regulator n=1 Tax=Streptomyces prunicolor TaxID=67348 RepID=A0ABU4F247_9ACTN|nr:LacI family DNA-binding transcriptional regulator [Streptomyces prunicolor]MCX5240278.1 LacI family DNA-binding transcriptional regulator [Streptomyces prunicolor]MDV7214634.1 LacI family DNA-binding transcriptional regulator [Streptomyces prunicolor]
MTSSTDRGGRPAVLGDVARLAEVSAMTVSRVLNEHAGVKESTRARVLAAVAELGYRPNSMARALVTGRSRVLGVVGFDTRLYGPATTLFGIEQAARDAGYTVRVTTLESTGQNSGEEVMRDLMSESLAGVILAAPHDWAAGALPHLTTGTPVVVVDVDIEQESAPVVGIAQHAGARQATEHLLSLGHRTVWHVAGPVDWPSAQARETAWRTTLTEAGRKAPAPLRGDWTARSGYEQGRRLVRRKDVTAVFAANDQMALGVLLALREAGLDVPGDVSLVGFDDIPEAAYFWPPLTTVRQDFDEAGRLALDLLVDQIEGAGVRGGLTVVEPELVVRASTGPAARN